MPHHVVVDGSNLATEGRERPSLRQLNDAVLSYMQEDPDALVTVVVDATFGHRIDPREVFPAAVLRRLRARQHQPDAIAIGCDGDQAEADLRVQPDPAGRPVQHQGAARRHQHERREFDEQIDPPMQIGEQGFLRPAFAQQGAFEQHFRQHAAEPQADAQQMQGQQSVHGAACPAERTAFASAATVLARKSRTATFQSGWVALPTTNSTGTRFCHGWSSIAPMSW